MMCPLLVTGAPCCVEAGYGPAYLYISDDNAKTACHSGLILKFKVTETFVDFCISGCI